MENKKSLLPKIFISIAIIIIIGVIWLVKTQINKSELQNDILIDGADFSLNVSTVVDYESLCS